MFGHFSVDMFGGLLPVLYPLMAIKFGLDKFEVGLVALSFTAASSLSQPLFGYIADRYGSRQLAPLSLVWSALMFGLVGFSPTAGFLIVAAFLSGLGSGAYHPLGAANASAATGEFQKNTAMSIYTVGGSSGYAMGPLLGAALFGIFGPRGSLFMVPLGFLAAFLILRSFKRLGLGLPDAQRRARALQEKIRYRPLAPIIAVVMLRSWLFLSVVTFIPVWYQDQGYGPGFYGLLTSLVIISGAAGTLIGGFLADRFGQRQVLVLSLCASIPALFLFVLFPGPIALLTGVLFGLVAESTISVTLVMAQRLLPGRVGMASGFILGLSFVAGGIGVPVIGALADRIGMANALMVMSVVLLAAILCVFLIPREALQQRDSSQFQTASAPGGSD